MRTGLIIVTVFALLGCHYRPSPADLETPGLRVRAETHLVGKARDTLQVWMTGENISREPRSFGYSTCPNATTRISSTHFTNGKPTHVWDYATMMHPELAKEDQIAMCSGGLSTALMPGQSATFTVLSVPVAKILGDSLPPGRYRVTAFPVIYFLTGLCAGEVDLRVPTEPSDTRVRS